MLRHLLATMTMACSMACHAGTEINQATEAELDSVKGLGPASTARILKERDKAPFKDWADLMRRVKGIKVSSARKLSANGLTVDGTAYPAPHR